MRSSSSEVGMRDKEKEELSTKAHFRKVKSYEAVELARFSFLSLYKSRIHRS